MRGSYLLAAVAVAVVVVVVCEDTIRRWMQDRHGHRGRCSANLLRILAEKIEQIKNVILL